MPKHEGRVGPGSTPAPPRGAGSALPHAPSPARAFEPSNQPIKDVALTVLRDPKPVPIAARRLRRANPPRSARPRRSARPDVRTTELWMPIQPFEDPRVPDDRRASSPRTRLASPLPRTLTRRRPPRPAPMRDHTAPKNGALERTGSSHERPRKGQARAREYTRLKDPDHRSRDFGDLAPSRPCLPPRGPTQTVRRPGQVCRRALRRIRIALRPPRLALDRDRPTERNQAPRPTNPREGLRARMSGLTLDLRELSIIDHARARLLTSNLRRRGDPSLSPPHRQDP